MGFQQLLDTITAAAIAVTVLFVLLTAVRSMWRRRLPRAAKLKVARRGRANGVIFGYASPGRVAYSPERDEGHIAVFGGSGSGKTSALLIPTLQSWRGSAFVVDISGDISTRIDTANKTVFAPMDLSTVPYSVFGDIDRIKDVHGVDEALERLAFQLMPLPIRASENAVFFIKEGRKILTAALLAGYHAGMDFVEICQMVTESSWRDLFTQIDSFRYEPAIRYINTFAGANEKNTAGCLQSVDEAIGAFARNYHMRNALRRPVSGEVYLTARSIEHKQIYIVVPDAELETLAPLLQLITAQTLDYISARPLDATTQILVALDEFASLGKLDITPTLRKARKRHARVMVLTQSMADIDLIYGADERRSMMANFTYKVVLGAGESDTQEYFSQLIGKKDTIKRSSTNDGGIFTKGRETLSTERVEAIEPAKLSNLGECLVLLHPAGHSMLVKAPYYESTIKALLRYLTSGK